MTLRLLLGDQLNSLHSWFNQTDDEVIYVLMEVRQETDYTTHHIQKIIGFFGAMRQFAAKLKDNNHRVHYITLDATENQHSFEQNLLGLFKQYQIKKFEYLWPDEHRLDQQLSNFCKSIEIPYEVYDTEHFLTTRTELKTFFEGKKQWVMEYFYRYMRKKFQILVTQDVPEGNQWNFDKNNRNKWKGNPPIPKPFHPDSNAIEAIHQLILNSGIKTVGNFDPNNFLYPLSRLQAQEQLTYFCEHLLPYFGDYQDAMHTEEVNLFHSRISFALNTKMLHPLEIIHAVITSYRSDRNRVSLSQVEGFVRQILGWREYMRGMYWAHMPEYKQKNTLQNTHPLPKFYWSGATRMHCLKTSINNTLDNAYAHHIQRLMVTGNFALLAQVDPDEVDQWYLGVYADAIEWVQLPNTRGMSQWADGGIVATKPYISAAAYINKMSNYCTKCYYDPKKRIGKNACPFNSLYWNFLEEKKKHFSNNNRMTMMLRLLEKIPQTERDEIKTRAQAIITNPDAF